MVLISVAYRKGNRFEGKKWGRKGEVGKITKIYDINTLSKIRGKKRGRNFPKFPFSSPDRMHTPPVIICDFVYYRIDLRLVGVNLLPLKFP